MSVQPRILLAEGGEALRDSLAASLRAEGWQVEAGGTSREFVRAWERLTTPLVVVLDPRLADPPVQRHLERWRDQGWSGKVVLLGDTASSPRADVTLARPIVVQALIKAIHGFLGDTPGPMVLNLRHCTVDLEHQVVNGRGDDETRRLTTREAEFLRYLAVHSGRTVSREELLKEVWGYKLGAVTRSRSVDKMLARLRPKLRDSAAEPEHIFTVYGGGYRFVPLSVEGRTPPPSPTDPEETRAPTNLPVPASDFVGRSDDLADLEEDLQSGARLVTVLGPGGVGKTRLMLHQAARLLENDPPAGGIWFCDLTEARDIDGLLAAVAGALQLELGASEDALDIVGRALAEAGELLLLLDNAEQIAAPTARAVSAWLQAAPRARFLVTSREALRVREERCFELDGLEPADGLDLFVQRARAVRRGFEPTPEGAAAIGQIVEMLDRLPLAIELAAARVTTLTPAKILERLERDFGSVLRTSGRDRVARQATLEGAVAWSWELLSRWEQATLAQLSVFRGGFFLEAAEAVVDLSRFPDSPPVFESIEALVLKSLVRREDLSGLGEVRFRLYETIRVFGQARLEEQDESGQAAARAQVYFLALAEQLAAGIASQRTSEALRRLALEHDNLLAVQRRAVASSPRAAVEATLALDPVLSARGPRQVHERLLDEAVQLSTALGAEHRTRVLCARGEALRLRGDFARAEADLLPALALAHESGRLELVGRVSRCLGGLRYRQGRGEEAAEHYRRALDCARSDGHVPAQAYAHGRLGAALQLLGRVPEALEHYRQAIALSRPLRENRQEPVIAGSVILVDLDHADRLDLGDGPGFAALSHLFGSTLPVGSAREAERALRDGLAFARESGDRVAEAALMASLGVSRMDAWAGGMTGALAEAKQMLGSALEVVEELGNVIAEASIIGTLGRLHHLEGDLETAEQELAEARSLVRRIGARRVEAYLTALAAAVLADQGRAAEAGTFLAQAEALAQEVGDQSARAVAQVVRGHLDLAAARAVGAGPAAIAAGFERARSRLSEQAAGGGPTPRRMAVDAVDVRLAIRALETAMERLSS